MENTIKFEGFLFNGATYKHNTESNRYSKTIGGKTVRIGKAEYDQAWDDKLQQDIDNSYESRTAWETVDEYIYELVFQAFVTKLRKTEDETTTIMATIGKDATLIMEINEATATLNQDEFDDYLKKLLTRVMGGTTEDQGSTTEAQETHEEGVNTPEISQPKENKEKPMRKPRKGKNVTTTVWFNQNIGGLVGEGKGEAVHLTGKQVEFLKHLPDTCFWENGLDSAIWVDCLCDEIKGEFANKPMTVGAMVSTLREKGVLDVGMFRVNGKKVKHIALTTKGKAVAKYLGVK